MGRNSGRGISFLGRKNAHLTGLFINNFIDKRILRIVGMSQQINHNKQDFRQVSGFSEDM